MPEFVVRNKFKKALFLPPIITFHKKTSIFSLARVISDIHRLNNNGEKVNFLCANMDLLMVKFLLPSLYMTLSE